MSVARLFLRSEKRKEYINEIEETIRDLFRNDFNKAKETLFDDLDTMVQHGATKCKVYFLSINDD
ncbi:hypothetical protein U472_00610 [Orenia metallireducens]|uniref:Uncharacterized protein n=1 Tax=Orenia metallireducens TaxID=1413210 RepID=A0A1C0AD70_9FIRM|nr:hypothetical protein [Orenia metallireducens]OCL28602.1 hypothetical protein U472_00610 [Orenia metallireducens]